MNLKKYSYYTFVLLLSCLYTTCGGNKEGYVNEEEEGYYTQNPYRLGGFTSMEETITMLSFKGITELSKKLADRTPKWLATGTEGKPYAVWNSFFTQEVREKIVKKLKEKQDTTLLEKYYDRLGQLFKAPTKENEKEVIEAVKKLQADVPLMEAFKRCIAAMYHTPETICLTEATLAYQQLLYFILEKDNVLFIKLKMVQSNLVKWKEDRHATGQALWDNIQNKYGTLLQSSKLYKYTKNQEAIKASLRCIDQLAADLYGLSYKDFLEMLPHGIKLLKDILYETGLEEKDDIELLKTYLRLLSSLYA